MTKEKEIERERAKNNAKTIENAMKHRRMNIVPTFYANKKRLTHTHSHFRWKIKRTETWNNQRGKNIEEDWSVNTTAWEARKMWNVWIFYDGAHKRFNRFIPFRCASNEWTNEKLKRERVSGSGSENAVTGEMRSTALSVWKRERVCQYVLWCSVCTQCTL